MVPIQLLRARFAGAAALRLDALPADLAAAGFPAPAVARLAGAFAVDFLAADFAGAPCFAAGRAVLLAADLRRGALAGADFFAAPPLAGVFSAEAFRGVPVVDVPPVVFRAVVWRPVVLRPVLLAPADFAVAPPVDATVPSETVAVAAAFRRDSIALRQDALRL